MQFKEEFVRQGLEGGKKAANALRQAIAQQCREADETEVIAKIVANLNGLAKAMKRDGSIGNENDLKEFMQGFTQAKSSFDFIDVGHGKERADSKIKGRQLCPSSKVVFDSRLSSYTHLLDISPRRNYQMEPA